MPRIGFLVKTVSYAVALAGIASLALVAILFGGYLISIATPCLCFDANGFGILLGVVVILAGAALALWIKDFSRTAAGFIVKHTVGEE